MASPLGLTFDLSNKGIKVGNPYKVYGGGKGQKVKSLFNGSSVFSPFPNNQVDPQTGFPLSIKKQADVHNNDIYDTSVGSIVKYTSNKPSMKLDYIDFAYLRNLGVYPNNRLIVARRFGSSVGNDLNSMKIKPMATMVSWVPEKDDSFLKISYSEKWVEADASYVDVLNDIGKDIRVSKDDTNAIGSFAAAGLNMLPLPGFSEPLQRAVMAKFGLVDDPYNLPLGNPNLIRQAKRRYTVSADAAESGLQCNIEVSMEVEYEQKFINGVDPSLVYLDIIQNALTFGTSEAAFQLAKPFATGATKIIQDLVSGDYKAIYEALSSIVKAIFEKVSELAIKMVDLLVTPPNVAIADVAGDVKTALKGAFAVTGKAFAATIGKYKQRLLGITNALTGSPSTPWHITIGNPKKPIFSSGDMYLKSVDMDLGKVLAFNDLPSTIKFTLKFENARPLGSQEIFNRLNTGRGRSYISVNLQSEVSTKNDGSLDQTSGPSRKNINTKTFDASPTDGEGASSSDVQYATTTGNGDYYLSYNGNDTSSGTVGQNTGPINVGEASVNSDGKLQNPNNLNPSNLQPSAQSSGNGTSDPQTRIPPSTSNPQPSPSSVPITASSAKTSSDDLLVSRKKNVDKETGSTAESLSTLENDPEFYFDQDAQNRSKELRERLITLKDERKLIENEQKSRSN